MPIDLRVKERLAALLVLPKRGDVLTLRVAQRAAAALAFTPKEMEQFGLVMDENGARWNPLAEEAAAIALEPAAVDLLRCELRRLDEAKQLTFDHLALLDALADAGERAGAKPQVFQLPPQGPNDKSP